MRHLKAQSDAFKPLQTVFYRFQPTAQPTRSTTKALVGHSSTLPFNEAPGTAPPLHRSPAGSPAAGRGSPPTRRPGNSGQGLYTGARRIAHGERNTANAGRSLVAREAEHGARGPEHVAREAGHGVRGPEHLVLDPKQHVPGPERRAPGPDQRARDREYRAPGPEKCVPERLDLVRGMAEGRRPKEVSTLTSGGSHPGAEREGSRTSVAIPPLTPGRFSAKTRRLAPLPVPRRRPRWRGSRTVWPRVVKRILSSAPGIGRACIASAPFSTANL